MKLAKVPLHNNLSYDYANAKSESEMIDFDLGFECLRIEAELLNRAKESGQTPLFGIQTEVQDWVGLPVQIMQTPYSEIRWMLSLLNPSANSHIVDLGCAYGRMALITGQFYPQVRFTGLELVQERVTEGNRVLSLFNFPQVCILQQDLADTQKPIPDADFYFIYDFGGLEVLRSTLHRLQSIAQKHPLTVIARGKGIRHEILTRQAWLSEINPPQHFHNFSIFYS